MIPNRTTLADMVKSNTFPAGSVQPAELRALQDDLAEMTAQTKAASAKLAEILFAHYGAAMEAERAKTGKPVGTVRIPTSDPAYVVKTDIDKKVEWNQAALRGAVDVLTKEWGENPAEYVKVEYSVSETAYGAWPAKIRDLFTLARTTKAGTPKLQIIEKAA